MVENEVIFKYDVFVPQGWEDGQNFVLCSMLIQSGCDKGKQYRMMLSSSTCN